jgi:hypothetical protein
MISHQVAGKAARDALFLSSYDVSQLPRMVVTSALLTIGAVHLAARALSRFGPRRLVSLAFLGSAALQFVWAWAVDAFPRAAAVGFYIHMAVFGAVLISWYWSMITEQLDPSTARKRIARIAGGGTLGGLAGGLVAERVAALFSLSALLPILGGLHVVCAVLAARVGAGIRAPSPTAERGGLETGSRSGGSVLRKTPYLRHLALLVLMGTVSAAFLDFVFKAEAAESFTDRDTLLRFFGVFYTTIALATFLVQSTVTRKLLEALRPAHAATILPLTVGVGGVLGLVFPGLPVFSAVRGAESSTRSSIFRSSYELFYAPVPRDEKRPVKTLVDVGFDRLGDALGGGLVYLALLAGGAATQLLVAGAAVLGFGGFLLRGRLHEGYAAALARSMKRQSEPTQRQSRADVEATQTLFLHTLSQIELSGALPELDADVSTTIAESTSRVRREPSGAAPTVPTEPAGPLKDPVLARAVELRSGDLGRVRRALRTSSSLPSELVPTVIPLLAWDGVATSAIRTLRKICDRHVGQLLDSLLDPDEEFAIRRRIPRVMSACRSGRAVSGLLDALADRRFEVRYQSGIALSRIHERNPDLPIDRDCVFRTIERETRVDRKVWVAQRLLDEETEEEGSPFHEDLLRDRATRSLEHVFTLLSLVFPREPLELAYRGLHVSDPYLRGTALEYMESILPPALRRELRPFLADEPLPSPADRSAASVLDSLLQSQDSIRIDLESRSGKPGKDRKDEGGSSG